MLWGSVTHPCAVKQLLLPLGTTLAGWHYRSLTPQSESNGAARRLPPTSIDSKAAHPSPHLYRGTWSMRMRMSISDSPRASARSALVCAVLW